MEYWQGTMNWPIEANWKCETCGSKVSNEKEGYVSAVFGGHLQWGFANGQCRCINCHSEYAMRDYSLPYNPIVTRPISRLKPEFKEPVRKVWAALHKPIDETPQAVWIAYGVPESSFVDETKPEEDE